MNLWWGWGLLAFAIIMFRLGRGTHRRLSNEVETLLFQAKVRSVEKQ